LIEVLHQLTAMASRGTGTLIWVCLLWLFFLCATIAFFQLHLVDNRTNQPSSREQRSVRIHLSATLFLRSLSLGFSGSIIH